MLKDDRSRLQHMLDACEEVEKFIQHKNRKSLDSDRQLTLALIKEIEIIGEAASRVSPESRKEMLQIPWMDIIGMRNRLIHAYFDINLDILWKTVIEDLPPLLYELKKVLKKEN